MDQTSASTLSLSSLMDTLFPFIEAPGLFRRERQRGGKTQLVENDTFQGLFASTDYDDPLCGRKRELNFLHRGP